MPNKFCDRTSPTFPSGQISEVTIPPNQDKSDSLQSCWAGFPVSAHPMPESARDWHTQNQTCGTQCSESSVNSSQNSLWWRIQKVLSTGGLEKFLPDSQWLAIKQRLNSSRRRNLAHHTSDRAFSLLPTPTTYACSNGKGGAAGLNRLENTLRSQGRLSNILKLNPAVCAWMMGFPAGWTESVLMAGGNTTHHQLNRGLTREHLDEEIALTCMGDR